MTRTARLFVPAITPFKSDLSVDAERFIVNCKVLLEDGADGLAPFGTTSEANSMSVAERIEMLDALIDSGVAPERLIPGTGCAALPDSIVLTRHAVQRGCLGALVLPPFYYKGVPEDGVYESYARIVEAVGEGLRIYLYHFPQMSGVPLTLSLIERLMKGFPGVFVGMKDSSGQWDNTHAVIKAFPELEVYPSSEAVLAQSMAAGGAGCISASANVNAKGIVRLIAALGTDGEADAAAPVTEVRKIFESVPLIPSIKAVTAMRHKDEGFAILRPPFAPVPESVRPHLDRAAALCFGDAA